MKINTRKEMAQYAMEISLPLMERTAKRRVEFFRPEVNDSAGYLLTFVENFCRPLWGIAPVLKESADEFFICVDGKSTEICSWIRQVLVSAVDEKSSYSWSMPEGGSRENYQNQMKTELAGLMVGMMIAREKLWEPFSDQEKRKIADWIYRINEGAYHVVWDCNHIWFILLNLTILKSFGFTYEKTDEIVREGLERLDRMYDGNGFYYDGQFGRFDYYGPWAMHLYPLLWCMAAESVYEECRERKRKYMVRTESFLGYYSHMFDSNGCHVPFGRSLAYRFAASAIFSVAAYSGCSMELGLARNIVCSNISYFRENAVLDHGLYPPGFLYSAPQTVENYTSDGGAYWCTKAFLALLMPPEHPFWIEEEKKMPSERGTFLCKTGHPKIHMTLLGDSHGSVTLYNNTAHYLQNHKKTQWFLDMAGFYSKFAYNSRAGFGISTRDSVSSDNMISLITPDGTMESHRFGFEDLGEVDRIQKSRHIPFANDPGTSVTTWVIILPDGYDVRIHHVVLAQSYRIREGGFSVPMDEDKKQVWVEPNQVILKSQEICSSMKFYGTAPLGGIVCQIHPGMNLLKPMAYYPAYESGVLQAGEYTFVSVHHLTFGPDFQKIDAPDVEWRGTSVLVAWKGEFGSILKEIRVGGEERDHTGVE